VAGAVEIALSDAERMKYAVVAPVATAVTPTTVKAAVAIFHGWIIAGLLTSRYVPDRETAEAAGLFGEMYELLPTVGRLTGHDPPP